MFSGLVKCPICRNIMSSSESFKYPNGKLKVYYHLRCKNHNCKGFGLHYNTEKIENKLKRILEELTSLCFLWIMKLLLVTLLKAMM